MLRAEVSNEEADAGSMAEVRRRVQRGRRVENGHAGIKRQRPGLRARFLGKDGTGWVNIEARRKLMGAVAAVEAVVIMVTSGSHVLWCAPARSIAGAYRGPPRGRAQGTPARLLGEIRVRSKRTREKGNRDIICEAFLNHLGSDEPCSKGYLFACHGPWSHLARGRAH